MSRAGKAVARLRPRDLERLFRSLALLRLLDRTTKLTCALDKNQRLSARAMDSSRHAQIEMRRHPLAVSG
jgi:hypothetical protein